MGKNQFTEWYSTTHITNGEPKSRIDELIYRLHSENKMKEMIESSINERESMIREEIRKKSISRSKKQSFIHSKMENLEEVIELSH